MTDLTVGQHLHYDQLVTTAGLRETTREPGESEKAFEERLLGKMLACGDLILELIGTMIIPEGQEPKHWTPKMARETADFIATLSGDENLQQVHTLFAHVYLDFFARGLSSPSSTTYFSSDGEQPEPESRSDLTGTGSGESLSVN